ncbi:hypothetical protein P5Y53_13085 [Dyella jiangningensis]|uniref:hypothetical protein n=1 Tax=Dyella jiangningensis TaxID=1379159 RepID=UPI00240FF416|nr:hypothetical protein [Dyella jiangningensis]MDG2538602.1 hypothetical protein [Dyella jiangningensis]
MDDPQPRAMGLLLKSTRVLLAGAMEEHCPTILTTANATDVSDDAEAPAADEVASLRTDIRGGQPIELGLHARMVVMQRTTHFHQCSGRFDTRRSASFAANAATANEESSRATRFLTIVCLHAVRFTTPTPKTARWGSRSHANCGQLPA